MKTQTTIFIIKGYDRLTGQTYVESYRPFKTLEEALEHCRFSEWVEEVKAVA